jgi:2-polyprenyl-3-methyl-5-hydroxy-6-metoxy-1,4-benzoquinol methylase
MERQVSSFAEVPVEAVQAYWDARPCNIRHSPKPVGTRAYFDDVEARKYLVEPHIPGFAEFERWRGKRVLEVGCGIGTDTINFARAEAHVTAVDLSEQSLQVARQRAAVFGLEDRIRFRRANAEHLSQYVETEPYDLIYSFGVIHHTPHPDRVLEQLRLYCHPGTVLKIMVYHRWSWKVLWIVATDGKLRLWRTAGLVARHSEAQTGCPVTYTYSRKSGRQWLERAGFRVEYASADHIFPYRIKDYVEYRYVKEWYFRWMPQPLFRMLEHAFGWHLLLEARGPADAA